MKGKLFEVELGDGLKKMSTRVLTWPIMGKAINEAALWYIGRKVQKELIAHIDKQDLPWKPLAPSTIRQKGHNRYLVDSGYLRDHIRIKVERHTHQFTCKVGPDESMHPSGKPLAQIMHWQEYGTADGHVPARPILRPTARQVIPIAKERINFLYAAGIGYVCGATDVPLRGELRR